MQTLDPVARAQEVSPSFRVQLSSTLMADLSALQPPSPPTGPPPKPQTDFRIGEEFGTARRNLPPAGIVGLCIVAVAVILGSIAYFNRQQPQAVGSIDGVSAVEVQGQ